MSRIATSKRLSDPPLAARRGGHKAAKAARRAAKEATARMLADLRRSGFPTADAEATALMLADLKRSGLTVVDAKEMRALPLTADQACALTRGKLTAMAYQMSYFDFDGCPTPYNRLRLLRMEDQRYWQLDGTPPRAYFPPNRRWRRIVADPRERIVVVEGEKKAYRGAKAGLNVLSLGGVFSYQSKKRETPFLEELAGITWKGREAQICFDSDTINKPDVAVAEQRLTLVLVKLGAKVKIVRLPPGAGGAKAGLDDYLELVGDAGAADKLAELAVEPCDVASRKFIELAAQYAVVRDPVSILERATGTLYPYAHFKNVLAKPFKVTVPTANGQRRIDVPEQWLESEGRTEFQKVVYLPRQPGDQDFKEVEVAGVGPCWNRWRGWPCEPRKGDVSLWRRLLDHVFKAHPVERAWFEAWCAYPVLHPGAKLMSAVVLVGGQGVGKSLLGRLVGSVYGANYYAIEKAEELHDRFNAILEGRQFLLCNEATPSRADAERLKNLITEPTIPIEQKYLPKYTIDNTINLLFTSNHANALAISGDDRRFFVWEFPAGLTDEFFKPAFLWLSSPDGVAARLWHLRNADVSKFDLNAPPPLTAAKRDMITFSATDAQAWARELKGDPRGTLKMCFRPVATARDLARWFAADSGRPVAKGEEQCMALALREVGFTKVLAKSRRNDGCHWLYVLDPAWAKDRRSAEVYDCYVSDKFGKFTRAGAWRGAAIDGGPARASGQNSTKVTNIATARKGKL